MYIKIVQSVNVICSIFDFSIRASEFRKIKNPDGSIVGDAKYYTMVRGWPGK